MRKEELSSALGRELLRLKPEERRRWLDGYTERRNIYRHINVNREDKYHE